MTNTNDGLEKRPLPSIAYLEIMYFNVSRINNGRLVHERDNIRQSLYFFMQFMHRDMEISDQLRIRLDETLTQCKGFIKRVWELEWQLQKSKKPKSN